MSFTRPPDTAKLAASAGRVKGSVLAPPVSTLWYLYADCCRRSPYGRNPPRPPTGCCSSPRQNGRRKADARSQSEDVEGLRGDLTLKYSLELLHHELSDTLAQCSAYLS